MWGVGQVACKDFLTESSSCSRRTCVSHFFEDFLTSDCLPRALRDTPLAVYVPRRKIHDKNLNLVSTRGSFLSPTI